MRYGYLICGLAFDAAHVVLAANAPPPTSILTTDWSMIPSSTSPGLVNDGSHFTLRIPGDARGLWRALEQMMDIAGVHRVGYAGLENHRLLLTAVSKIRNGATDRVLVNFTLSPEQLRLQEMERFEEEHADWWSAHLRCLEEPGCADVFRRGR